MVNDALLSVNSVHNATNSPIWLGQPATTANLEYSGSLAWFGAPQCWCLYSADIVYCKL